MSQNQTENSETLPEEVAQNPGARVAAINRNPTITQEEAKNANEGKGPNGAGGVAPSSAEYYVPSSSNPNPTDLPSTT
ncbi:hypothetical protein PCC9214_05139 [Planktothrix tepida]|uniref:Uncharacterized protein n=3 Tax=Microcoleaceae TaxID=1892252 RepID=A0A1J1LK69_9CYAN|nr:hypothetical protein NO713_00283 [Planktothrix pseudagardhii]CAD5983215.1 hypothetical protein PCC9214_05139 [Planktothrix tepida]CUR32316.1 conserved hypothetical protein [Planktothrix tepida PCC 9214]